MQEAETPTPETGTPEPGAPEPRVLAPKEVAQYLPAPNVRRAIAAVVIPTIVIGLVGIGTGMLMLITQTVWAWDWFHATTTAIFIGCLCAGIAWAISERPERLAALRATHRRRNVLGFSGMFWFEGGTLRFRPYENEKGWDGWTPRPDPVRAIGPCPKRPPWKDEHRERYDRPYAMIPLGGRRSSFKYEYDADGGICVTDKAGRRGVGWKIGFVGLAPDGSDLLVTVTDPTGTSIRCSLRQAFTILTVADQITPKVGLAGIFGALIASALGCGPKPVTIGDVLAYVERELREAMEGRDAAEAEVARLTKAVESQSRAHRELERHDAHAICLAMEVLEQLDAAKPTGRTIEWLHRKQRRLNDLLRLLPETHYMRKQCTEMLATTEAAIAEHDRAKAARRQGVGSAPPA